VDVLVANAMRWGRRRGPGERFEDVAPADWMPVIAENLAPTVRTTQLAVAGMRAAGWGRIALISSHVATDGHHGQEFYGAAKAGLHGFARSLAWDVGPDGVLVNVVCPGLTLTRRVSTGLPEAVRQRETARTASGQLSRAEDIAAAVVFLCSAANRNITGEVLTVAGGR
jgi:3-oxoacyl-[acyl-carrier protein] reductase